MSIVAAPTAVIGNCSSCEAEDVIMSAACYDLCLECCDCGDDKYPSNVCKGCHDPMGPGDGCDGCGCHLGECECFDCPAGHQAASKYLDACPHCGQCKIKKLFKEYLAAGLLDVTPHCECTVCDHCHASVNEVCDNCGYCPAHCKVKGCGKYQVGTITLPSGAKKERRLAKIATVPPDLLTALTDPQTWKTPGGGKIEMINDEDGLFDAPKSWHTFWPETRKAQNLDVCEVAADFYILQALANFEWCEMEFLKGAVMDDVYEAREMLDALVTEIDPVFLQYFDMSVGGELRHHHALRIHGQYPNIRAVAWVVWGRIREALGARALDLAEDLFLDFNRDGYGGVPWAEIANVVRMRVEGQLTPELFVDRAINLQHHGGVAFNKVGWAIKNRFGLNIGGIQSEIGPAHSATPPRYDVLMAFTTRPVETLARRYFEHLNAKRVDRGLKALDFPWPKIVGSKAMLISGGHYIKETPEEREIRLRAEYETLLAKPDRTFGECMTVAGFEACQAIPTPTLDAYAMGKSETSYVSQYGNKPTATPAQVWEGTWRVRGWLLSPTILLGGPDYENLSSPHQTEASIVFLATFARAVELWDGDVDRPDNQLGPAAKLRLNTPKKKAGSYSAVHLAADNWVFTTSTNTVSVAFK